MASADIRFSQLSLKETMAEVRPMAPDHKDASVFKVRSFRDTWEFRFREFYWADKAHNAYEARDKGWQAWMAQARRAA